MTIDPGEVRGPSAGLAFTLAVLDVLTPGDITNGVDVAVTGTIDGLGRVGRSGASTSRRWPRSRPGPSCSWSRWARRSWPAAGWATTCEIVPVATLQDALEALDDLGADATDLEVPDPA